MENSRRKLLKALTLGGSAATVAKLPTVWSRPVLETVALPTHAQTTSCAITIDFRFELTGNYTGNADFFLFDTTQCHFAFEDDDSFDETFTFPLGPGSYYFGGGGGGGGDTGSVELELMVSCCDRSERVAFTLSGSESGGDGMTLLITIREDGRCDIDDDAPVPKPEICLPAIPEGP